MPLRAASERTVERLRFGQAPLAAAALWFAAGIAVERWQAAQDGWVPVGLLLGGLALLAGLAVVALRWAGRVAWVPVAGVWLLLGIAAAGWHPSVPEPVKLISYADNLSRTVRGRVVQVRPVNVQGQRAASDIDSVQPWEAAEDVASVTGKGDELVAFDLAVEEVEDVTPDLSRMVPVRGGVRVAVYGAAGRLPALACGDRLEMPLRMKLPERYRDPGVFDYGALALEHGVAARAGVAVDRITRLGAAPGTPGCRLAGAQSWASGRLPALADSAESRRLPAVLRLRDDDARMLNAMLFGDRSGLSHSLRAGFERTGSFHLFVVSGMHVALVAGAVFWVLRRLRAPGWLATIFTLGVATGYAALTGFGQPAQRALGMTAVFLLARLLNREQGRMPLNALGAAALAMLVWAPGSLFQASFQMTVLAIVAIVGVAIPLAERTWLGYARVCREVFTRRGSYLAPREAQFRMMLELWGETLAGVLGRRFRTAPALVVRGVLLALELALVGVVAELALVLPMAVYFHRATLLALPANLVVVPVIVVLVPAAVLTFAASLVSPWLALVPGGATALLLHGIRFGINRMSHLQAADVRVPGPVWWIAGLVGMGWLGCCWLVRRGRVGAWLTVAAVPLLAAVALWPEAPAVYPGVLEVTAIDVGQGDSLLAVNPEGGTMLIDAGGPTGAFGRAEVVANFDVGDEVVSPYLWSRRLRRVDVVVLTHAHTDHMGGMPAVLGNFRPRELWVGIDPHSELYAKLLEEAAALGVTVRHVHAGDYVRWGTVGVSVLAPSAVYLNPGAPKNDDSVVLRMDFGRASALMEGDAERPSEDAMVAAELKPVTLLKVGHHGSRTSTSPEFLAMVHPQDAVVSSGRGNSFGHPRGEVIGRLAAAGTRLYRTDEFGLSTFLLSADGGIKASAGDGGAGAGSVTVR